MKYAGIRYNHLSHYQKHWLKINSLGLMAPSRCPSAGAGPEGILHGDSHRLVLSYQNVARHSSLCSGSALVFSLFAFLQNRGFPLFVYCYKNHCLEMLLLHSSDFSFVEKKVPFSIKCIACTPLVPHLLLLSLSQLLILYDIHAVYGLTRFPA